MLREKQVAILPNWIVPIAVDLNWKCRHEQYAVGRDVSAEAQRLRIIIGYADALLTLKDAREAFVQVRIIHKRMPGCKAVNEELDKLAKILEAV